MKKTLLMCLLGVMFMSDDDSLFKYTGSINHRKKRCDRCGKIASALFSFGKEREYKLCEKCRDEWRDYVFKSEEGLELRKHFENMRRHLISFYKWSEIWYKHFRKFLRDYSMVKLVFT